MANSYLIKLASAIVLCMVVSTPHAKAAITCGMVTTNLSPCMRYLMSNGGDPPPECCSGVKNLNGMASNSVDKQAACVCLKAASNQISGINYDVAAALPGKCGVNIPYKISPTTDCSTVR